MKSEKKTIAISLLVCILSLQYIDTFAVEKFVKSANEISKTTLPHIRFTLKSAKYPSLPDKRRCKFQFELENNTNFTFGRGMILYLYSMENKKYPIKSYAHKIESLIPREIVNEDIVFRDGCRHVLYGPIKLKLQLLDGVYGRNNCQLTGVSRNTSNEFSVEEFELLINTEDQSIKMYGKYETNNGNLYCYDR